MYFGRKILTLSNTPILLDLKVGSANFVAFWMYAAGHAAGFGSPNEDFIEGYFHVQDNSFIDIHCSKQRATEKFYEN